MTKSKVSVLEDTNVQLMSEKEVFSYERESLVNEGESLVNERASLVHEIESLINERESFIQIVMRDKGFTREQALLYIQGEYVVVSPITRLKNLISRLRIFLDT